MKKAKQNGTTESIAVAHGRGLSISTRHAVEICNAIRHRSLQKAKRFLTDVIAKKEPVRFTRFNKGVAHKKKIGPGRYPVKAAQQILALLNNVEANARFKALDVENLFIVKLVPNEAARPWRYGRRSRVKAKRTHVDVVVATKKKSSPAKNEKKPAEAKEKKPVEKKEEKDVQK